MCKIVYLYQKMITALNQKKIFDQIC